MQTHHLIGFIFIYIHICSKNKTEEKGYTVEKKGAGFFI